MDETAWTTTCQRPYCDDFIIVVANSELDAAVRMGQEGWTKDLGGWLCPLCSSEGGAR